MSTAPALLLLSLPLVAPFWLGAGWKLGTAFEMPLAFKHRPKLGCRACFSVALAPRHSGCEILPAARAGVKRTTKRGVVLELFVV